MIEHSRRTGNVFGHGLLLSTPYDGSWGVHGTGGTSARVACYERRVRVNPAHPVAQTSRAEIRLLVALAL